MQKTASERTIVLISMLSIAALVVMIALSPGKLIADERDFYPNLLALEKYGFTFDFLRNIRGQSPGPLYQYIYYPIGRLVPLTPIFMRYVNFAFLLCNLLLLRYLSKVESQSNPTMVALLLLSLPMMWLVAGTAFTEMPTMFFSLASMALLYRSTTAAKGSSLLQAAIGGVLAGIAVTGRSPYVVVLPAAALLYALPGRKAAVTLFVLMGTIAPGIVFYTWRGLVPPDVQGIQSGYQVAYWLLAVMYLSIGVFIIYPAFFRLPRMYYILCACIVPIAFVAVFFLHVSFLPFRGVFRLLHTGTMFQTFVGYLFPALVAGEFGLFFAGLYQHMKNNRQSAWKFFLLCSAMLMLLTTIKSAAHFASKYVVQAFPFFLLYVADSIKVNRNLAIRVIIGTVIGMMSLGSYYVIHKHLPY